MPGKHWKTFVKSRFPWEQEALDFIYTGFPAQDTYAAWANFEFIADDGSINEVDLVVACPQGIFLIEIKSRPGTISGDPQNWLWEQDGRKRSDESPLLRANRKCKRLKCLLLRQRAFRKAGDCFFIEPSAFVSHPEVRIHLRDLAANHTWAGWNHLQQTESRAAYYIDASQNQGWPREKLRPLLAGLAELLPWLKQWHNEFNPDYASGLGDYFAGFLDEEARKQGTTVEALNKLRFGAPGR